MFLYQQTYLEQDNIIGLVKSWFRVLSVTVTSFMIYNNLHSSIAYTFYIIERPQYSIPYFVYLALNIMPAQFDRSWFRQVGSV